MTTLLSEESHADPLTPIAIAVEQISRRYQQAFASTCHCGDEGCAGDYVPPAHDYRVLAMTLAAGIGVVRELRQRGCGPDIATANKLVTALDHHARRCADEIHEGDFAGDVLAQVRRFCGETPIDELFETQPELRAADFDNITTDVIDEMLAHPSGSDEDS